MKTLRALALMVGSVLLGCAGAVEGEPGSAGALDELPPVALIASTTTILPAGPELMVAVPGGSFTYTLEWNAQPLASDYLVFVHFVDAAGELVVGHDYDPPERTSQWKGRVSHTRTVELPQLPEGTYSLMVGLYEQRAPWDRVELARAAGVEVDEESGRYVVGSLHVGAAAAPEPSNGALTSVLVASPLRQMAGVGTDLSITFEWDAVPMAEDYRVFVHLVDSAGNVVGTDDYAPPERTSQWSGRISHLRWFRVPPQISASDAYSVRVGLYEDHEPWGRIALATQVGVVEDDQRRYHVAQIDLAPRGPSTLVSNNGKCLELHHDAMPAYANTSVYLAECNGGPMQGWVFDGDRIKSAPFGSGDGVGLCLSRMPNSNLLWARHCSQPEASRWERNGGELYEEGSYTQLNPTGFCIKAGGLTYNTESVRLVVCSAGADPAQQWTVGSQ